MGTPLIVGLSGKKQSGKDTICSAVYDYLHSCSDLDDSISVYSFADALKQKVCKDVLGLTEEQVNGTDEQKNSPTIYKWDSLTDGIRYTNSVETEPIRKGGTRSQYEEVPVLRSGSMTAREIMQVVGTDIEGEVRIVELPAHRFFIATLFLPQLTSSVETPHPLIVAYLQAAKAS